MVEAGTSFPVGEVHKWMYVNLDKWQDRNLGQICVPSSHDSGMSLVTSKTSAAAAGSVITQFTNISYQLNYGVGTLISGQSTTRVNGYLSTIPSLTTS